MTTDPKARQAEMQALRDAGLTLKQIGAKCDAPGHQADGKHYLDRNH